MGKEVLSPKRFIPQDMTHCVFEHSVSMTVGSLHSFVIFRQQISFYCRNAKSHTGVSYFRIFRQPCHKFVPGLELLNAGGDSGGALSTKTLLAVRCDQLFFRMPSAVPVIVCFVHTFGIFLANRISTRSSAECE